MKKMITLVALVATMAVGTSAFASGQGVANCAQMSKGQHVKECAQMMDRGVSECATSPECPMQTGC